MSTRMHRWLSDRRKLFALIMLLTATAFTAASVVIVHTVRTRLTDGLDQTLTAQANQATIAVEELDSAALAALGRAHGLVPDGGALAVFGPNGDLQFRTPATRDPLRLAPLAVLERQVGHPFDVHSASGAHWRAVATGIQEGRLVVFARPFAGVAHATSELTRTIVLVGVLAAVVLALVLWWILVAAAQPTEAMIAVATRIGDGDLTARVDPDAIGGDARRLGIALNNMMSQIESAFARSAASEAQLRSFVADASHELRTPLTNIRGYAQLCRMGAAGDADIALARIDTEARRMSTLVDDLLLLARLDQGRERVRVPVDLTELTATLVADARTLEPDRPIELRIPDEPLVVLGDEDELHRAVANLLANVRAHTDRDVRCAVSVAAEAGAVIVVVHDEGAGMHPDDGARAFDRFFRPDPSRSRDSGGSGLGLSIAKAVVDAHGGTISFVSTPGGGTTVRIALPRTRALVAL